jgi:5-hydroxyisourate hydrolase
VTLEFNSLNSPTGWQQIGQDRTNSDGRCPTLLPVDYPLVPGIYRCTFDTAAYYGVHL